MGIGLFLRLSLIAGVALVVASCSGRHEDTFPSDADLDPTDGNPPDSEWDVEDADLPPDSAPDADLPPDSAPDAEPDTQICEHIPTVFEGDGTHTVRHGDTVVTNNGVRFEIRDICLDSYTLMTDAYVGTEQLNHLPILNHSLRCTEYYGVSLRTALLRNAECGYEASLSVESLYHGPIESRRNLYDECRSSGEIHSWCSEFIPHEPSASETIFTHDNYRVMIPSAADPIIAEYYLNQLEMGHEQLLSLFDISEHTPFISLRWYLPDGGFPPPHAGDAIYWPAASPGTEASTLNFIRDEESGGLTEMVTNETVIHELSHVMRDHLRLPHWMEEGLSTYAEVYATERTIHHEPIVEGTFPLGAEIEIPGLPAWWRPIFSAYDEETDSVAEERTRQRFTAMSQTTYRISSDSSFLLSVERVSSIDITIRVFHDRSFNRSTGWTYDFQTERMETGYRENHGVYIDDEFYRTALPQPEVIPYTSLDTGGSSGAAYYKSAYCFFEGIRQLYGHNVIPRFLHMVEEGRERDEMACPPNYCMLPALEAPTGADLSSYFELFDVPMSYDCYPSSQVPPVHSQSRYCPDE